MRATLTDEQQTLAETAGDLADGGLPDARALLEGDGLPEEPTASLMGGFAGLGVPEERGGVGGGLVDLAILLERLGRRVVPGPYASHVLAIQVALAAGLDVTDAAAGETRWTLAVAEPGRPLGPYETRLDDGSLSGDKTVTRDGESCQAAVVAADTGVAVATPSERHPREALDPTRPLADLGFDGPPSAASDGGDGHVAVRAVRRAVAALSAELVGVGRGAVQLAVDYAKVREQFGQPVGRFQGVAHQLADAWTGVENAWSLALYACWAVGAEDQGAARAVHTAKSAAGGAAIHAAERGMQVHGGTGITWEADPHLYLRRAVADDNWLGTARHHRQLLGTDILGA